MENLEQKRAAHAWGVIKDVKEKTKPKDIADFKGEAKKMPVRIVNAGLGHALLYLEGKASKVIGCEKILAALNGFVGNGNNLAFMYGAQPATEDMLRLKTAETLAYLQWLNRFATAELPKDSDHD